MTDESTQTIVTSFIDLNEEEQVDHWTELLLIID
eukprot:CAMPEP_0184662404 /NCGR_PEP_ID=MMETSP0308-20130426/43082_1 /TAXON_ID=38269 /ORGANISM="Gloeochaete witrockiana, Strain SAG 46.84" /LENGTH=33 /DNA_ID= /DNA_START= /DNA_END= /DNA_ORIENTATION=